MLPNAKKDDEEQEEPAGDIPIVIASGEERSLGLGVVRVDRLGEGTDRTC